MRFDPTLYLVTDTALCAPRSVPEVVAAAVAGGVTAVQVRDKTASRRELLELTRAVQAALADRRDVAVVVDDALDVALLAGADGVHVGRSDLPVTEVRAHAPHLHVGLSVGTDEELAAARALPAGTVDLLGIGPVWATATKTDAGPALGPAGVARLVAGAGGLTTVAIGGVRADRVAELTSTGVDGVCVVSDVCAAPDPHAAAAALRRASR
ncbi:thiamine phosphate synthase [Klenkia taihuensis]|uniref:Thiamine-phosphate synthase n=1 Tax=Klenkia taihuensis TaxID=1225127 RepID=A0A1I1GUC4_9ACTN|nr:thiamine phosphate synthase [Klenkia taihuensis]GHE09533.1 thiamine-phosphate synthase [Klenkia taihuensis]SFC15284.1 thiamine-phosphate pyrophosphorylase [Klenkia taihuensis]